MALLGFAAGLPILLIFSSLSLWLAEAGVARASVTMFSWAALGYSFKFVWAPLVDRLVLPGLGAMGRRRSWLMLAQLNVVAAIGVMSSVDPATPGALPMMALAAVWLGFASATQDIAIDAYRIECAPVQWQAMLSAAYIAGYRVGMVVAGAGALWLADAWGSTRGAYAAQAWQHAYQVMAACMLVGVLTTWRMPEPTPAPEAMAAPPAAPPHHGPLLLLFAAVVAVFVAVFSALAPWMGGGHGPVVSLLAELLRLALALAAGLVAGQTLVGLGWVPAALLRQTWLAPVQSFFFAARCAHGLAAAGAYWLVPHLRHCVGRHIECVLYGHGLQQARHCAGRENLWRGRKHCRRVFGWLAGHALGRDALLVLGRGGLGAHQRVVCLAGTLRGRHQRLVRGGYRR